MNRKIDIANMVGSEPIRGEILDLIAEGITLDAEKLPLYLESMVDRFITESADGIQAGDDPLIGIENPFDALVTKAWEDFKALISTLDDFDEYCQEAEGVCASELPENLRKDWADTWLEAKISSFQGGTT